MRARVRDREAVGFGRWWAWAADLPGDLRYAVRSLRSQPSFTLVALISLAIGMGFNTAVFSIINTVFLAPHRGVSDPDRLVYVGGRETYPVYRYLRDNSGTLMLAASQAMQVDIRFGEVAVRSVVPVVSSNYFAVLGVKPYAGRFFDPQFTSVPSAEAMVVLEYEFWRDTLGGDPSVIGRTLTVNGVPAAVVGIAPRTFYGIERQPLWIPLGLKPALEGRAARWNDPADGGWRLVGRLADDADASRARAELQLLASRAPDLFPHGAPAASTGRDGWTGTPSPEKRIEFLLVVVLPLAVVGLILWIGCSNVANLLLARAMARRKEIAVRLATGATRGRIIRLLMTESLLLAVLGGGCGLLVSWWTLDLAAAAIPDLAKLATDVDGRVLLYTAAISLAATVLFGSVPALHSTRVDVAPLLKGEDAQARPVRGARIRRFFLVTQFAASMALLLVAGTFVRTLLSTQFGEQAARMDQLVLAYVESGEDSPSARRLYWQRIREALAESSHAVSASFLPGGDQRLKVRPIDRDRETTSLDVTVQQVDQQFFETAGMPIVQGEDATREAARGPVERIVVNERAASLFSATAGTGATVALDTVGTVAVAGVVRDGSSDPRIYRRVSDDEIVNANILIRTPGPSAAAVPPLRQLLVRLSRDGTYTRVATLREAQLGTFERLTRMALAVGAVVLALAAVGLYGAVSFYTSQRRREIAIRAALGAPRRRVLRVVAREAVAVVAAGALLGLLLSAIAFRYMSGMLFAQWTLDPVLVGGVTAVFAVTTLAACFVPLRRALGIDPMSVLKSE